MAGSKAHKRQVVRCQLLIFLCCLSLIIGGCVPFKPVAETEKRFPEFVALFAEPGDTLSSLAAEYLGDSRIGWIIAEFNQVDHVRPGQALVVPLELYRRGGLSSDGYQVVPILTYHNFSRTETSRMTVSERAFEEQMAYLKANGYQVLTLDEFFRFLEYNGPIPPRSVVITVDDGWRSFYDIAFPILKKYDYPATLFVYTDLISGSRKTLSWAQIQEMAQQGIDVQCHTKSHRRLDRMIYGETLKDYVEALEFELESCLRITEHRLGPRAEYLAYPYGEFNLLVLALSQKAGYKGGLTVERGSNPFFVNPFRVKRNMIYGRYELNDFIRNLKTLERVSWP